MRICFFTENSYKGGMDKLIYTVINNWPDKDDIITLLCNRSHPGYSYLKENIINNHMIKPSNVLCSWEIKNKLKDFLPNSILSFISFSLKYIILPYQVIKLTIFFNKSNFDKILIFNGGYPGGNTCRAASVAWRLSKKKKALMACLSTLKRPAWYAAPFEYVIDRFLSTSIFCFIFPSKFVQSTLSTRKYLMKSKHRVIFNGIDSFLEINSLSPKNKQQENNNKTKFLMLATFEKHKGHELLFDSIVKLLDTSNNFHFTIAGFGTIKDRNRIQNAITSRKIDKYITLLEFQKNTFDLYSNTDAVVVPSTKFEGLPLTALEAMSLKKPLITTNTGGLKEIFEINPNIGLISEARADKYSNNLITFIKEKEKIKFYGENGFNTYNKFFTSKSCAIKYHQLLMNENIT